MSQEPKETSQEKPSAPVAGRPPKKEVELFPPIAERNLNALPAPASSGGRLATQISMFNPVSFEEALEIVDALRARHATTISLDKLKKGDASRLVDFVAGASAALDGDFHKMTEQVFVFCPANIRIVNTAKQQSSVSSQRPLSGTGSSSSSNFALDALFPELAQEKMGSGLSSPFWARQ